MMSCLVLMGLGAIGLAITAVPLPDLIRQRRLHDELIPIHKIVDLIPSSRRNKKLAVATVYRWILRGELQSLKIGGARFVTAEALTEFIRRKSSPDPLSSGSSRASEEAGAELDSLLGCRSRRGHKREARNQAHPQRTNG
jgi:hypothetical protein